jgi:exosortase
MAAPSPAPVHTPSHETETWALLGLLLDPARDPQRRPQWLAGLLCLGLFALLFGETLTHFSYSWSTDENYSHGFLVPLISLYFANQAARRGAVPIRGGALVGATMLAGALAVRLITIPLPIPFLGDLAFLIGLAGLVTLLLGEAVLKRYWFAFFFLVFMVPLPIALYSRIASPLQLLASRVASTVMNATGVPVLCEGNRMTLPGGVQMFVAEACSGMRQLTGFLALTTAVAWQISRPGWYRALIVLLALPIALSANIARVVLTGYIMHFVNPEYASGTFHTIEGLLMMGFGLMLLQGACWCLDSIGRGPTDSAPSRTVSLGVS